MKRLAVLILLIQCTNLSATTIVAIITKNGIVISSDTKTVSRQSDYSTNGALEQSKAVVIENRIVIAAEGISDWKDGIEHYNFRAWTQDFERRLAPNSSLDQIVSSFEKEITAEFASLNVEDAIRVGKIARQMPDSSCEAFANFLIAGYQEGKPLAYRIQFEIDWNEKRFIGPILIPLHKTYGENSNFLINYLGAHQAIEDFQNKDSYAFQQLHILAPSAIQAIANRRYPTLSETVTLSRAFVQIEKSTNPETVGGSTQTFVIAPTGSARVLGSGGLTTSQ